jgi:hypothetical protein
MRLVCRKCNRVFHMNVAGKGVLGDPPAVVGRAPRGDRAAPHLGGEGAEADWRVNLYEARGSLIKALIAAGVLSAVWLIYFLATRAPESLTDRAQRAADALAANNQGVLKAMAGPDTAAEAVQLSEAVRPQLEKLRGRQSGQDLIVGVVVQEESRRFRRGIVSASFFPPMVPSADRPIMASKKAIKSLVIPLFFDMDQWGQWRLDGRQSLQSVPRAG